MNQIKINNSIEHIMLFGYFQHAFEFYLQHLKPKDVEDIQVVEMKSIFANIRASLRAGNYLKPNILNGMHGYPVIINFNLEEKYWFDKIIKFKFDFLYKKTLNFYKKRKLKIPSVLYFDLLSNLRTNKAIEFFRTEFLKKKQIH